MNQIGGNEVITEGEGVEVLEDRDLESILERSRTVIKVIGCGGSGTNTIQRMTEEGILLSYLL